MSAKPAFGFASRTDAVLAFRAQGMSDNAIAAKLGIERKTVSALACSKTRTEIRRQPDVDRSATGIKVATSARQKLRPYAAARHLSVDALVRLIVEKVADDGLTDAVLDDEGVFYI